jgi:hypothetical protein
MGGLYCISTHDWICQEELRKKGQKKISMWVFGDKESIPKRLHGGKREVTS